MDSQTKNEHWARLVQVVEKVEYGRIELIIKDGVPIRAEVVVKQIKLDCDDDLHDKLKTIPL